MAASASASASAPSAPARARETWRVPLVPELYGLPDAAVLGSYGGGDAMQMSRQLLVREVDVARVPEALRRRLPELVRAAIDAHNRLPRAARVARLPERAPDLASLAWRARLHLSSQVYGAETVNVFAHGALFKDVAREKGRLGATRYPLVGLFDAEGVLPAGDDEDPAMVGLERLAWSDQHVHKVGDAQGAAAETWHFGSDMSRFALDAEAAAASFWCVVVDLESGLCELSLFLVLRGDLEDAVDKAVAAARGGDDGDALLRELRARLGDALSPALAAKLASLLQAAPK